MGMRNWKRAAKSRRMREFRNSFGFPEWAHMESNHGPRRYQRRALNQLSYAAQVP